MYLANPYFLIALVAIAIPIIVHLFNFRRYRKIYFSNVDYLDVLQQQTRRQSNLVHYLILASRILAIIFLVLAFARPIIPAHNQAIKSGGSVVSIYLDNSYSMNNRGSEGTLIDMGKSKVREIVAAYQPSAQFQLITNQANGSQFRYLSHDEILNALDEVEASPTSVSLSSIIEKQHGFLKESVYPNRHCYIVSDFQETTSDFQTLAIDSTIPITFIPLKGINVANLYIDSIALNAPAYYVGNSIEALVFVSNTSDELLEQVSVKLYINESQRAVSAMDIPAHGQVEIPLKFTIDKPDILHCRVELTDYPITFDDRMYFSINVVQRNSVLTIGEDNLFLSKLFTNDSAIIYTTVSDKNINFNTLSQYNLIILNQLATIPSGLSQTLSDIVIQGGAMVVIPPKNIDKSYNEAFEQWHLPNLSQWQPNKVNVSGIDFESSLYKNVFTSQVEDMELPQVNGHYLTSATANTLATSIIPLVDGSDFLTMTSLESGFIYLFTTPLEEEYTNFVRQALFVPTLYNMALYSRPMGNSYYVLGEENYIPLYHNYEVPHLLSLDGANDIIPEISQQFGHSRLIPHGQVKLAGNYILKDDTQIEALSFNYNRQESIMKFLNYDEVEQLIQDNHLPQCSVVKNPEKSLETYIRQQNDGKPLWKWCLLGALLMLLAEVLLIRFGMPKNSTSSYSKS